MRVIVCGGRDYKDQDHLEHVLDMIDEWFLGNLIMATGSALGADELARYWNNKNKNSEPLMYPADWETHGKAAGPIRNKEMLIDFDPDFVVAFPGGKGTADMVKKAQDAGVTVLLVGKSFPL